MISFLMYQFYLNNVEEHFIYVEAYVPRMLNLLLDNYQMNIPLQIFYKDDIVENI